ncbi:TetR/AcrR family transcriptional regulator [Actinotalea subterranea]|uniref:TetR/AcrR family transcriptional regulator n=1 Tax=Actinotalea subterranea TaxID=2607497 RepID=UPI001FEB8A7D|nr:TetR/AcrR family transcriptional regulator [Actinotalea subterranea]
MTPDAPSRRTPADADAPARTSAGDPARTLALLWRDPSALPRRGPRRALDVDTIVDAAISLADDEGLAGLTMRAVARRAGVPPMSVYTYVPGKAELLDLMLDAAYARMDRRPTTGLPWRERVRAVAEENMALYEAHPWAAAVSTLRPPLGPGQMAKYEHELAAFDDAGLDDVTVDDCLTHLLVVVRACARDSIEAHATREQTAQGDEEWWAAAGPVLERVLDPAAYPRASRIGSAAGEAHGSAHEPAHAYRFALDRVLDGLERLVEGRAGTAADG